MLFSNNHNHCIPEAIIPKKPSALFPLILCGLTQTIYHAEIYVSPLPSQKNPKIAQCLPKKVAKSLSPLTHENCLVFPSSRQPQFQIPLSFVTSIHTFALSLVLPLQVSLSLNLASLFFPVLRSLSSIVYLLSFLLLLWLLSELPILPKPSSLLFPFSLFFSPPLSVLFFLLLLILSVLSFLPPLVFLFVPPLLSSPFSRPLLVLSAFFFLPSFLPILTAISAVHNPWQTPLSSFPLHVTFSTPRPA